MTDTAPLILTAAFDPASAALFGRLRDQHFPPRLNIVPAHCTLFHHLPGADRDTVGALLNTMCGGETPMRFASSGLRFMGRGVAIDLSAERLVALRLRLAAAWGAALTPQDRQGFRPHVTIQNKVDPGVARTLHARLAAGFAPVTGTIEGLDLWVYRGGPWDHATRFTFGADPG